MSTQLQTTKVITSNAQVSKIMMDMLTTMNGKSPTFVNFMVGLLKSLGFEYFEIIGMFSSSLIKPSENTEEVTITEHELRHAWVKNKKADIEEKEAEWFFIFCNRLGISHLGIIRMMHERNDVKIFQN